jgi:hypothetical protein
MVLVPMTTAPAPFFLAKKKQRLGKLARKSPFVAPELFEGRTIQVDQPVDPARNSQYGRFILYSILVSHFCDCLAVANCGWA